LNTAECIVKIVPTLCATAIVVVQILKGQNHDLALIGVIALLGLDVTSIAVGKALNDRKN